MKKINHWINGKNVAGADYFHTTNPATGEVLAEVASGGEAEINQAVAAAKEAFPKWAKEGANKQVISSQADSLIKISRIWADFFPANNRISLFRLFFPPFLALFPVFTEISPTDVSFGPPETGWPG
ncbi:5-carboxymethyl-2-hydroxymuconate semialdehyde dehydrogenase [Klebsiella pneumoniae]|nr:5-carboxymethyl-2-hydroxymuconate semialdehyde dehydrogenase [Klebsiella pneumoniae]